MDHRSRFWDRIAEKYARQPVSDEAAYQKKLDMTRALFREDSDVFEFGCGTGTTAIHHAPRVRSIRAIDVSEAMLAIARGKAEAAGLTNVTFERAAIEDLTVPDSSYDVVLGMSILHLVPDRRAVLGKVHRMLKPGGAFVSSTACLGDRMWFMAPILPIGRAFGLLPFVKVFQSKTLRKEIKDAGFEIETDWQPGKTAALFIIARKPG